MKKLLAILCLCCLLPGPAPARSVAVDGYAAMVNRRAILLSDVLSVAYPAQMQLRQSLAGAELEQKMQEAYQSALDELIERALIIEEFTRRGGMLPERAVDAQVNSLISDRFNNDRLAFLNALARERITFTEWREQAKESLMISVLRRQEVLDRAAVAPRDVLASYEQNLDHYRLPEQVHLRLIMLHAGETDQEREVKRQEAGKVRARIEAGEDFAELARTLSEGAKAAQGGDRGWLEPASLQPALAQAITGLAVGEVSPVVETPGEFYLAKVEGRKQASVTPFEEVRADIEKALLKQETERLYDGWIARLKKRFYVHIFEP